MLDTLEMVILDIVARGRSYGFEISETARRESHEFALLREGSIYLVLHRLQRQKLLSGYQTDTEKSRPRKYYKITPADHHELERTKEELSRLVRPVPSVMRTDFDLA